jgi:hypothetical protein
MTERRQLLQKGPHLLVVKGPRGESDLSGLLEKRLEDVGVAVSLVQGGVGGEAIEVFPALGIPDPDRLGPLDHDVEGMVVVGSIGFRLLNEFLTASHHAPLPLSHPIHCVPGPPLGLTANLIGSDGAGQGRCRGECSRVAEGAEPPQGANARVWGRAAASA